MSTKETLDKQYLRRQCQLRGWSCYSAPALGAPGWPDKMVLCGNGVVWFCEIKAAGTRHDKGHVERQKTMLRWLYGKGHPVSLCLGRGEIDDMIKRVEIYIDPQGCELTPHMGI